jgi:uncharacterized protein (TIGR02145 family)
MKNFFSKFTLVMALMLFCSCASNSGAKKNAKVALTDSRDKKIYKTVKIGEQTWMAENLNFDAKDSKCYNDEPQNCEKQGRLYSYETAKTACPSGWHLPNNDEWGVLLGAAGGYRVAGKNLRSNGEWKVAGANGDDKLGFSALPAGYYSEKYKKFKFKGYGAYWWAASDSEKNNFYYTSHIDAGYYMLDLASKGIFMFHDKAISGWEKYSAPYMSTLYVGSVKDHDDVNENSLLNIRCVKD